VYDVSEKEDLMLLETPRYAKRLAEVLWSRLV
jgi:hypothetical protein